MSCNQHLCPFPTISSPRMRPSVPGAVILFFFLPVFGNTYLTVTYELAYSEYFIYIDSYGFSLWFLTQSIWFQGYHHWSMHQHSFSGPTDIPLCGYTSYDMFIIWWAFGFPPFLNPPEWCKHSGTCFCLETVFSSFWPLLRVGISGSHVIIGQFCIFKPCACLKFQLPLLFWQVNVHGRILDKL